MAALDISEYIDTSHGNPIEPPVAHQTLPLSDKPSFSKPLNKQTRCVLLASDVNCRVSFGAGPAGLLFAGRPDKRVVQPGEPMKVSAVIAADAQSGGDHITSLLALITDPKKAAKRKAELEKLEASVKQGTEALHRGQDELAEHRAAYQTGKDEFDRQSVEFKEFFAAQDADLTRREKILGDEQKVLDEQTTAKAAELKRREDDVTKREDSIADRVRTLTKDQNEVSQLRDDLKRRISLIKSAQA